ncbi:dual specificity protein phosphatase 8 isoform X1 [Meles meles]|uniref:dual specificity protein phosphatase 8 isoform X1 n=1 Tax=Meles meles TaxID=9662 RepID=UPI001E698510|nr:dual specificity protein phosphatase 8 isoform X1 [Meles meles]XP_045852828.1 dual specificity protein phosphatase 8 isoform X1 [Meles meles]XP_045872079.1 dual specificity protein phosphatase 8 isoform X1 [Meles meles]XP_045872081.1 dual specificity protein phosphatase 8 isoform X1 [Meles meles]
MAGDRLPRKVMDAKKLASLLRGGPGGPLVIDSRSFVEYNSCHVLSSVNICCSKLVKRRLQQGKVTIAELIQPAARGQVEATEPQDVVVYDQSTRDASVLAADSFLSILLSKLDGCFDSVAILTGGFATFSSCFPGLCEGKPAALLPMSLSQPCLPVPSVGLTRILPHLYLGSQKDVLNKDLMTQNGISYVLNASNSCPKPDFICESRFMRVPVNDSYCEKLLPWLDKSIEFIDKAKLSSCQVIVHCLAGISRSATIAIAYIMKTMGMSSDDAYRFVKDRRPSISPNFNFLGQLLEYERSLKLLAALQGDGAPHPGTPAPLPGPAAPLRPLPPPTSESAAAGSAAAGAAREGAPGAGGELPAPAAAAPATSALQQGLRGLHLSSDRLQDTNRLKRSFSLDIKSAYAPSRRPDDPGPPNPGEAPKVCKLDSPSGGAVGLPSPGPDSPDAASESRPRLRRRPRPPAGSPARSPAHGLGLNFGDASRQTPRLGLSALSAPGLPGPGQPVSPGSWAPPLDSPGTPSPDGPWCFSPEGAQGAGGPRFGPFGLAGAQGSGGGDLRRREAARAEARDARTGWPEEPAPETQFKRRSCQMEFEEGMVEGRARGEELAALGKQASFSGSVEVIEVS